MSRKPDGNTVRKEALPSVRVTPKQKAAIAKRAEENNMTVSEYIRHLVVNDLKEGSK